MIWLNHNIMMLKKVIAVKILKVDEPKKAYRGPSDENQLSCAVNWPLKVARNVAQMEERRAHSS